MTTAFVPHLATGHRVADPQTADDVIRALGLLALAQEQENSGDVIERLTGDVYRAMGSPSRMESGIA